MWVHKTQPDGSVVYAWKIIGTKDPVETEFTGSLPNLVWTDEHSTPIPPESYEKWEIAVSEHGIPYTSIAEIWDTCYVCQTEFPISKMIRKNGHWYCQEDYEP